MECEKIEKKYTPEISEKELEELRNSIKKASLKIIAENIEHMKKRPSRPETNKAPRVLAYLSKAINCTWKPQ